MYIVDFTVQQIIICNAVDDAGTFPYDPAISTSANRLFQFALGKTERTFDYISTPKSHKEQYTLTGSFDALKITASDLKKINK